MTKCPGCSSNNAYCGLYGWKCDTPSCNFYDGKSKNNKGKELNSSSTDTTTGNNIILTDGTDNNITISGISSSNTATNTVGVFSNAGKIQHQKDVSVEIINSLLKTNSLAILAGGAPRNWKLNLEAKDLDIFTTGEWLGLNNFHSSVYKSSSKKVYPKAQKAFAHSIHEFTHKNEKIQIITLKKFKKDFGIIEDFMDEVFRTFDWSVCKVAMDQNQKIFEHPDYISDIQNKKITLNISNLEKYNKISKLPERFKKMKALFPGYEAVIV